MDDLTVIVLAAGGGTRMKSKTAKVLHPISGLSMVEHVLRAVNSLVPATVVAVVGHQRDQEGPHIEAELPGVVVAVQETQEGTGHAVRIAWEALPEERRRGTVLVAYGDTPLLTGESLRAFVAEHEAAQRAVSLLSGDVADPSGYGRVVRDGEGEVLAIVEHKDASPEQLEITEINSGIMAFEAGFLVEALPRLGNDNAKGEYYLTDLVGLARDAGGWRVTHASAPRRSRAEAGHLVLPADAPLGDASYRLLYVVTPLDALSGHTVVARGLLVRTPSPGVNVMTVDSVAAACPVERP